MATPDEGGVCRGVGILCHAKVGVGFIGRLGALPVGRFCKPSGEKDGLQNRPTILVPPAVGPTIVPGRCSLVLGQEIAMRFTPAILAGVTACLCASAAA